MNIKSYILGTLAFTALVQGALVGVEATDTNTNGSKVFVESDGASIQVKSDGTKIIHKKDGTVIEVKPDGSKSIKRADGSSIEVKPAR